MSVKVGMVSLGCPKNQMDAELMLAKLEKAGYRITADSGLADVVIVNTCGFIEDAKRESIENILEFAALKSKGRIKKIIVTGCMAERYREEVARELPECDAVIGLGANRDIVDVVREVTEGGTVCSFPDRSCWELDGDRLQTTPSFFAYLRIADGCDNRCTYCAIPLIRGGLRSRTEEAIVAEAQTLAANGVKELILIAQDVTAWGTDIYGEPRLPQLLRALCRVEGLHWIRLLYCYPEHITDELLTVMREEEKIVKYLDMPIQHVSEPVLRAMNRRGDVASLTALVNRIRTAVPNIVLRTTVMVGFPGESKADFAALCEFVKNAKIERLGCFAYSPEEGTPAAQMEGQISDKIKQRRRDIVMQEQALVTDAYNTAQVGRTVEVLVESYDRYAECWFGRSAGDAPDIDGKVFFTCPSGTRPTVGEFVQVHITDTMDWDLMGEMEI
ncbi:MAG: 30S ribosomal protein S12 methylthiotransferase RimO [Ruminococcaceae bacterium]|nr:30S ribosomal protein S12 methylthiotransferase RimO [Oscillospiraceae bacterium]